MKKFTVVAATFAIVSITNALADTSEAELTTAAPAMNDAYTPGFEPKH